MTILSLYSTFCSTFSKLKIQIVTFGCILTTFVIIIITTMMTHHHGKRKLIPKNCCSEYYCYSLDYDRQQFGHFSTYTTYPVVNETEFYQTTVPNCNPVKIWMLNRHGTRYPSEKALNKSKTLLSIRTTIINNYLKNDNFKINPSGRLCLSDLELIKNWEWDSNISIANASQLAPQGWKESYLLAQQYKNLFPNLIDSIYSPTKFLILFTMEPRTSDGYKAFVDGLFGINSYKKLNISERPKRDLLLQPYEHCNASKIQSAKIYEDGSELKKFEKSQLYFKMVEEISYRLGYNKTLKHNEITLIWNMCRYEQSWHVNELSPWCAAFTPSNIKILEYAEDIQFYYRKSHGSKMNLRLACPTFVDMIKHLDTNNTTSPKVILYFTHSTLIYLFLTFLGTIDDATMLKSDNYKEMQFRKFQSSKICPFGSNIAAIKYECDDSIDKVLFLHNQKRLNISWCESGLCNWSNFKQRYQEFINADCETIFCSSGFSINSKMPSNVIFIIQCLFLIVNKVAYSFD